jgi:hypothetical protein
MEKNRLIFFLIALFWTIPWKAIALWRAARNRDRIWFGAIFLIQTLAILEIIYIFFFSKKNKKLPPIEENKSEEEAGSGLEKQIIYPKRLI